MNDISSLLQSVESVPSQLLAQWSNPSDIFSLLLLVGGDVIQKALANFHGRSIRPIAFSFGWVAYAFSALLAAVGHLNIMPDPDCPYLLFNIKSGQRWENQSCLLGRIIHNHNSWGKSLKTDQVNPQQELFPTLRALRVYVYKTVDLG